MPLSETDNYLAEETINKTTNQQYGSFKDRKKMAKKVDDEEMKMEIQ